MAEEMVNKFLVELVEALPRRFSRTEAAGVLERLGLSDDQAEGILQTVSRMPGVTRPARGRSCRCRRRRLSGGTSSGSRRRRR